MKWWQRISAKALAHATGYLAVFAIGVIVGITQLWDMNLQTTGGDWLQFVGMILIPLVYYFLVQKREETERDRHERTEKRKEIIRGLLDNELKPCRDGLNELFFLLSQAPSGNEENRNHAEKILQISFLTSSHLVETKLLLDAYGVIDAVEHAQSIHQVLDAISKSALEIHNTPHGYPVIPLPLLEHVNSKLEVLLHMSAMFVSVQMSDPKTEEAVKSIRVQIGRCRSKERIQASHSEKDESPIVSPIVDDSE